MKSRGIFAIVSAFVAGIGAHIKGKQTYDISKFVPTDNLLGAVNPFLGHHHTRGPKRTLGAFGNRAHLARYARNLDPKAVKRACRARDEIAKAQADRTDRIERLARAMEAAS